MSLHKSLGATDIHIIYALSYATAAARTGAIGLLPADVGKVARQTDNETYWVLTDDSPVTWAELTGTASVPAHASTHLPAGADPLAVAAPVNVTKAAAAAGTAESLARSDHKHDVTTAAPVTVNTANAEGTASSLARSDHAHAHGAQTDGTLHAAAVAAGASGFLIGADKTKIDLIDVGSCRALVGLRDCVTSAAGIVDAATNNNMAALALRNQASDCELRWMLRPPRNWTSGDVTFRYWWSAIASGSAGQGVRWEFGFKFQTSGTDLGAYSTTATTQDVSAYVADQLTSFDFTLASASVSLAADLMAIRVARIPSNAEDNFTSDVYFHALELIYTGNRLGGIHGNV